MTPRHSYLTEMYGEKVVRCLAGQSRLFADLSPAAAVAHVMEFDPSPAKKYSHWLVGGLISGAYLAEDLPKARETLELFQENKRRLDVEYRDIGAYRSLADLWKAVKVFEEEDVVDQSLSGRRLRRREREDARRNSIILTESEDWIVAIPLTVNASKWWGRGTRWCTSADTNNAYFKYASEGPLFVIDLKTGGKLQLWFSRYETQFTDADDAPVTPEVVRKHRDKLLPLLEWAVTRNGHILGYIPEELRTVELCLEAVRSNGRAIAHVPEHLRTKELCLEAVRGGGSALMDVPKNVLSDDICMAAVKNDIDALRYVPVKFCTAELCLEAVRHNGRALRHVPARHRSADLILTAIRSDPAAFLDLPTELRNKDFCVEAARLRGAFYHWIPKDFQSAELCLEALRSDGSVLKCFPEHLRTKEMCSIAVKVGLGGLKYTPERHLTRELCLDAVRHDGSVLGRVPEFLRDEEMCAQAVAQSGSAIDAVPAKHLSSELCLSAVRRFALAIERIPDEFLTPDLCLEAVMSDGDVVECVSSEMLERMSNLSTEKWIPETTIEELRSALEEDVGLTASLGR